MRKQIIVLIAAVALCGGAAAQNGKKNKTAATVDTTLEAAVQRIDEVMGLIDKNYVQRANLDKVSEKAVVAMLRELDPHSVYIPAKEVQRANEGLQGNFEGVGISFQIVKDTINVMEVIQGGPSEKVGIQMGDKIIAIDGENATGDTINNSFVFKRLRGKKGTIVKLDVLRPGSATPMQFTITRDKVPIYSVDTYFMVDDTVGYIRLTRFARTSVNEFRKAHHELTKQGMKCLIFDLRGNGGGFLDIAFGMANEFLPARRLIVYTEGLRSERMNYVSRSGGSFQNGRLVVLIDENSASASEIVAGALQDWERATIIGRRSFGKGLVQRMFTLKDGGQVRLTTARYFTPSGRCIQKPYDNGTDAYHKDLEQRYLRGELINPDSIHMPDSLKFKTVNGRTVYGGGGIMPDVFIPMDTIRLSDYYMSLRSKGLINNFTLDWANAHRSDDIAGNYALFLQRYDSYNIDKAFAEYAEKNGVTHTALPADTAEYVLVREKHSNDYLHLILKAMIAKDLFGTEYYYRIMCDIDEGFKTALREVRGKK
ncbi:MAG: S41 family peptidase [Bacteroidales bacterium]|nr:S41 family peptidase [Bacteroidales bacterium]